MLRHLNNVPTLPERTIVIGAAGFVGGSLMHRLAAAKAPMLGLTRKEVELQGPNATEQLVAILQPGDAVVAVAARAPCKNIGMMIENMVIAKVIIDAVSAVGVAHVMNISSDAVYADGPLPLTEDSPTAPTSIHGAMHLAREIAFSSTLKSPLATLRPSLLYGAGDPHNGYGPNRFRRLANEGKDIVLFGEGEERRDHVLIDDVAELIFRVLTRRSTGTLNIATGETHSFRYIAERIVATAPRPVAIKSSPRNGPMPHKGYRPFDIAACKAAFPDFSFTPIGDGIGYTQNTTAAM
jgi:UDP-glucose 4-epimerase